MKYIKHKLLYVVLILAVISNAAVHINEIGRAIQNEHKALIESINNDRNFTSIYNILNSRRLLLYDKIARLENKVSILKYITNKRLDTLQQKQGTLPTKPDFERLMNGTVVIYNGFNMVAGTCIKEDDKYYYILTVWHILEDNDGVSVRRKNTVPESSMGLAIRLELIKSFLENKILQNPIPAQEIVRTTVRLKEGGMVAGEFLFVNKLFDLALLRIHKSDKKLPIIKISDEYPKVGDEIYVLGHSLGRKYNFSRGIVSNLESPLYIGVDALMTFGNSGGGVFNVKGELVGVSSRVPVYRIEDKKKETILPYYYKEKNDSN